MNTFTIKLGPVQSTYVVILVFTLVAGFLCSLNYEFKGPANFQDCTFLFVPEDAYADLISPSLVMPPFEKLDLSGWPDRYRAYYEHGSHYITIDLTKTDVPGTIAAYRGNIFTCLHVTPATLWVHIVLKRLILKTSPQLVVALFQTCCVAGVCALGFLAYRKSAYEYLFITMVLLFSYPMLMIVSRANIGSLLVGVTVILFLHEVCRGGHFIRACSYLTIACLSRPNAILLAPLLLALDRKWFLPGLAGLVVAIAAGFTFFFHVDAWLYPGYTPVAFLYGLKDYTGRYILGPEGDFYNNSAYGCVKILLYLWQGQDLTPWHPFLLLVNGGLSAFFAGFIAVATFCFYLGRLSRCQFAFITLGCYILATAVCGTYHTFVFAAFLFILSWEARERLFEKVDYVILAAVAFIFIPKNYFHIYGFSYESILNPLFLFVSIVYVFGAAQGWKLTGGKREVPLHLL